MAEFVREREALPTGRTTAVDKQLWARACPREPDNHSVAISRENLVGDVHRITHELLDWHRRLKVEPLDDQAG